MRQDIIKRAPDGSEVVFPAGTPQDVIDRAMLSEYGGAESADLYTQDAPMVPTGESADLAIDLSGYAPHEIVGLGLRQGDWVSVPSVDNGTPFQLAEDVSVGAAQLGAQEAQPGVMVNPPLRWDQDAVRSLPTGIATGITQLLGLPGTMRDALGVSGGRQVSNLPTTAQLDALLQAGIGNYYEPQTVAGEYARTIGQNLPGAIVPGGVATKAASVIAPALLSETAGQLTEGTPYETPARIAGGVVGGLGVGLGNQFAGGARGIIREATEGVTPQQLQLAAALRQNASRLGVDLTNAEALQRVTGGTTNLPRVQRVVEGNNTALAQIMAQRPQQSRQAIAGVLDQIAPEAPPSDVARRSQEAASGVLNTMRQRVNESAQPFYNAMRGQEVPLDVVRQLEANPSYMAATEDLMGNPELAAQLTGWRDDISTIDKIIQRLDELENSARPSIMSSGNNTLASQREQAGRLARQLAGDTSEDFRMARLTGATGREAFVEPLRAGTIGRLAGQNETTPALAGSPNALFPADPFPGQPAETAQALRLMGEIDPTAPPDLVRQFLGQRAAAATQDLQSGPNQFGGARFAADVFGNPVQRENILGAVDVAAPMASRDLRDLVEVLAATGTREGPGSQTAFSSGMNEQLRAGGAGSTIGQAVTNPVGIPGQIRRGIGDLNARVNSRKLAEILQSDPQEFSNLVNGLVNRPRGTTARSAIAGALLGLNGGRE